MELPPAPPLDAPPLTLGDRSVWFPHLEVDAYLSHSAISPATAPVQARVQAALGDFARQGMGAFPKWMADREALRAAAARLIGAAAPEDVALLPNTSTGVIAIAQCYPWASGDGVVVLRGEFPTNVTPWQQAASRFGLDLAMLDVQDFARDPDVGLRRLEDRLRRGGVRVVAVSAVQFQTGLRMPLEAMGALCHRYGAHLFVDAIQAVGATPIDVQAQHIDALVSGSHKWLMAPEGASLLYVAPSLAPRLRHHLAGWLSHQDGLRFLFDGAGHLRYDRPIKPSAEQFEVGAPNTLGFAGLRVSVEALDALGVHAVHAHVNAWFDAIEPALQDRGLISLRTPYPDGRSTILSALAPKDIDIGALGQGLTQRGVVVTTPDGLLRIAPHWANALDEVPRVLDALDDTLRALRA